MHLLIYAWYLHLIDLFRIGIRNLSKAHTSPPSTVLKDAFDKKQKQGLEMTPYEIEQLAKKTVLRSSEVEIWVMHLSIEIPTPPTPGQGGDSTWHHYKS